MIGGKIGRAWGYARGLARMRGDDLLLASFPRSGNTWLRFLLANTVSVAELGGREVDFDELNAMMPELGVSDLGAPWPYRCVGRVIKTHRAYFPLFGRTSSVLVIRDPRDVMVSYYHYTRGDKAVRYEGSFSDFVRSPRFGLAAWFAHFRSWRGRATLVLRYEELRADPTREFQRLLALAGARVDDSVVDEAVRRSAIGNIRRIEETREKPHGDRHVEGFKFARDGGSRQWVDWFDDDLLALYRRLREAEGLEGYR